MIKRGHLLSASIRFIASKNFLRATMATAASVAVEEGAPAQEIPKPLVVNGRFKNSWGNTGRPGNFEVFKFLTMYRNDSNVPSQKELDEIPEFMVEKPDYQRMHNTAGSDEMHVTWLGHASVLFQIDGANILSDPVFGEYCGVAQRRPFGTKRFRDCKVDIEKLPPINAVVISHDHYDHLDTYTVKKLNKRFGDKLRWYVPLGTKQWMNDTGCTNIVELNWGDEHELEFAPNHAQSESESDENVVPDNTAPSSSIKMVFAPAQHWCTRSLMDENKRLWGSWVMIGPKHRAYFAGDSGYCMTFKIVGDKYGPFDLAAIPIGAYRPRDFMKNQHCDPSEAVKIHQDVRAKKSLAIHWGTFPLGYENTREPVELLKESLEAANVDGLDFFLLKHGQTTTLLNK